MADVQTLLHKIEALGDRLGGKLEQMLVLVGRLEERDGSRRADLEQLKRDLANETSNRLAAEEKAREALERVKIPVWKLGGALVLAGVVMPLLVTLLLRAFGH